MSHNAELELLRLMFATGLLGYAALQDIRTRSVKNLVWIVLAIVGFALVPVQIAIDRQPFYYLAIFAPVLAILSDVYWEAPGGSLIAKYASAAKYSTAIVLIVVLALLWGDRVGFRSFLAVPVMMLFVVVMYMLDIIRGGADAKALLSLSILFPVYPMLQGFPALHGSSSAQLVFPFSFVILVNAAIIVAFMPLAFLVKNLAVKEFRFPQGLLGYRMDHEQLKNKRVWLMERIDHGEHRLYTRPKRDEDLDKEVDLLVKSGHTRLWVTPKIPFIVPMLASLIFTATVGNLILFLTPGL